MANETKVVEQIEENVVEAKEAVETVVVNITEIAHKLFLASLGAMALAQEEIVAVADTVKTEVETRLNSIRENSDSFTTNLVERGESFQAETRTRINEVFETPTSKVTDATKDASKKATSLLDDTFESVLTTMNIPTKNSIDTLNKKIGTLGRKVDNLRKAQEKALAA